MEARTLTLTSLRSADTWAKVTLNDSGNADRLIEQHGDHLRFVKQWGWLVWDGKRWARDAAGQVMEYAKKTALSIYTEAADEPDRERREDLVAHARRSLNAPRLREMVSLAQSDPRIAATPDQFDRDIWLFNCQNGTLDLQTGELRRHDPADLITHLANAAYDPDATSEVWDHFLADITCRNAELAGYLQRAVGYSLTGDTSAKGMFFCYGAQGDNGKTTLLEAILYAVGDYGKVIPPQTIMEGISGTGAQPELVKLPGARFVITKEPDEGETFKMGLVKQLTGSDTISVRDLYKEPFAFKPQLKLWMAANDKPRVREGGDAAWRRIRTVPFNAYFPPEKQDLALPGKLEQAADAILAWAVEGCRLWREEDCRLREPSIVQEATQEYRDDQDPVSLFIRERCTEAEGDKEEATKLHEEYARWALANDAGTLSKQALYAALEKQGFKKGRSNGKTWIYGLTLSDEDLHADSPYPYAASRTTLPDDDDNLGW